ncbi:hypothetical protein M472_05215 [Sphingobacterium paucimobilis HER1398]|uniref:Endonuclease/exonuclease/phosphatase domain-containing protein n=2 Tax=Sphingobacterium TaxID=28453 RepID=U2IZQ1_9SPHI|nr:hypothetical protein M472_05215 [Sphingobacterium paucimobilis HER1398]
MKYWILFIVAFFALSCGGKEGLIRDFEDGIDEIPTENENKLKLHVGSYNLRLITSSDLGVKDWANRKQWVRKIVDTHEFDILGTQEGVISQLDDIVMDKNYEYIAVGRDDGKLKGETSGILFRKDKFNVLSTGSFWLSETPAVPSKGWDANINRICTWIQFKELVSGKIFFFFNVHYDHQGAVARLESSKLMLEKIKEIAGDNPAVMTGDLNAEPTTDVLTTLTSSSVLWDSKTVTTSPAVGPVGTFYDYDLTKVPTSRIDYVLVNKSIKVLGYKVIDDDFTTGNIASDHLPVSVDIEF